MWLIPEVTLSGMTVCFNLPTFCFQRAAGRAVTIDQRLANQHSTLKLEFILLRVGLSLAASFLFRLRIRGDFPAAGRYRHC